MGRTQRTAEYVLLTLWIAGCLHASKASVIRSTAPPPPDNPGLAVRVTQSGLDFAVKFATEFVKEKLEEVEIPNIHQALTSYIGLSIEGARVSDFSIGQSAIRLQPGSGLELQLSDIHATVNADYTVDIDTFFYDSTKYGQITVEVEDMHITLGFTFNDKPSDNYPFTVEYSCTSDSEIELDFEGDWSDGFELFSEILNPLIENEIASELCRTAKKEIDNHMNNMPLIFPMGRDDLMELDSRFSGPPICTSEYVETFHCGRVLFAGDRLNPSSPVAPLPAFPEHTSHMTYLYLTEGMLNELVRVFQVAGFTPIQEEVATRDLIPHDVLLAMDFSCQALGFCFMNLASEDSRLVISIDVVPAPVISILPNNTLRTLVHVVATVQLGDQDHLHHLASSRVEVDVSVTLSISDQRLGFDFDFHNISAATNLDVMESLPDILSSQIEEPINNVIIAQVKLTKKKMAVPRKIPIHKGLDLSVLELVSTDQPGVLVLAVDIRDIDVHALASLAKYKPRSHSH